MFAKKKKFRFGYKKSLLRLKNKKKNFNTLSGQIFVEFLRYQQTPYSQLGPSITNVFTGVSLLLNN